MHKLLKIFAGLLALVVAVLVALVILVKVFVTPERVKAVVLPLAEQSLHRPISLGDVSVGLTGIELRNLAVAEPGESEPFVAADRVLLRFQWLPLLSRQVVIDEVALEQPRIRLIRRADGSLNVSELLAAQAAGAPPAKAPSPGGKGEPLSVLVTTAKIHGGQLAFVDRQVSATTELSGLELDASGIGGDGTVPVKLSAQLQGAQLKADGIVRPLQKEGSARIELKGFDALAFAPYFRDKVPGKLGRLVIDLQGDFGLQGRALTARGKLQGRELNLSLAALPTVPVLNARIEADYDLALDLERDHLAITSLAMTFNALAARLNGEISALTTAPRGDLQLTLPGLDLAGLRSALPGLFAGKAAELEPTGVLQVSARANGPFSQPLQVTAGVKSAALGLKGLAVSDFVADLALRDNQLSITRMTGKAAGGSFTTTARVDLRRAEPAYDANLSLQGVQVDPLLKALAPQAAGTFFGALTAQAAIAGSGTQWASAKLALSGDVALSIADGRLVSPALVKGFASFLQLPDMNEIAFRECRGNARIGGGKADVDGTILNERLKLFPKGVVGLDGALNLAVDTRLSPELTARLDQHGKVTRYLLDADGWSQVPLLVTGSVQAPRYGIDPKVAGKVLQNELQQGLDKWLNKSKKPAEGVGSTPSPEQQPASTPSSKPKSSRQLLEESLKRVLGR